MRSSLFAHALVPAALVAMVLACCLPAPATAGQGADVFRCMGVVVSLGDRGYAVELTRVVEDCDCQDCTFVHPNNLRGLMQAGHVEEGDDVLVQIVVSKGKHRGHVTILK